MKNANDLPDDHAPERDSCRMCSTEWKPGPVVKRRTFLSVIVGAIYAVMGAAVLGPVFGFIGGPLFRAKAKGNWLPIANMDELQDGETKSVNYTVRERDGYMEAKRSYSLYLHRVGDEVVGFDPICPHLGCHVQFKDAKNRYICPCHGGVFTVNGDLVSGPPPHGLNKLTTKIEDGRIWLHRV